jgi:hypothetical protein
MKNFLLILLCLGMFLPAPAAAQDKSTESRDKSDSDTVRLTIVVTAGEDKKPVDSASVYVRFVEGRKLRKDKKIEMNLKTNAEGVCHSPEIPQGKILVQVIAPGWKTFGEYYDVNEPERTIQIELAHPPKWY